MYWVNLLEHKSYFLDFFKMFFYYVQNHFSTSILTIRFDNALEFEDSFCKHFYAKHGIVHQTFGLHRVQQNSRVERKHRQILEIARALKFQSGLSAEY